MILVSTLMLAVNTAFASTTTTPPVSHHIPQNPTEKIHLRFSHQTAQINKDVKLGKLTKAQEKILMGQVEIIRKQEMAFLKADNAKVLTDSQEILINSQIDALSKTIPIK
jgi:hypothetical protein